MKRTRRSVSDDPVVAEVRSVRRKLLAEAGGSVRAYLELLRERAARRTSRPARARRAGRKRAA